MAGQARRLTLLVPRELFSRLEEIAATEDRDPIQQARVILKRVLLGDD